MSPSISIPPALLAVVEQHSTRSLDPALADLVDALAQRFGSNLRAVLFYGSCLRSGNPLDGLVDLYVIVDNYDSACRRLPERLGARLLPPNVYYLEVSGDSGRIRAKFAILCAEHLASGTSPRWFHSYLWGRFAQPTALAYARDRESAEQTLAALAQSVTTFLWRALPCLPAEFDAATAWRTALALSYSAELRVEKQGRAAVLVDAFPDYYEAVTAAAAPALGQNLKVVNPGPPALYRTSVPTVERHSAARSWALRRAQGKVLSVLRLLKGFYTFDGGLDYIVWKLERHSGQTIEVPERVRRYPLLFIWGLFWRLHRRGVFR